MSGGNDLVLQADPEKMLGACLSHFLVRQLWTRKVHRAWNQGSTCRAGILSWCAWPISQGGDVSQQTQMVKKMRLLPWAAQRPSGDP